VVVALPIDGTAWVVDPATGGLEVIGGALGILEVIREEGIGLRRRLGEDVFQGVCKGASRSQGEGVAGGASSELHGG